LTEVVLREGAPKALLQATDAQHPIDLGDHGIPYLVEDHIVLVDEKRVLWAVEAIERSELFWG